MRDWFLAGGWVMWFLSVLGILSLLAALKFARVPDLSMLPRVHWLAQAVGWATLTGVASDLAAVGTNIPNTRRGRTVRICLCSFSPASPSRWCPQFSAAPS